MRCEFLSSCYQQIHLNSRRRKIGFGVAAGVATVAYVWVKYYSPSLPAYKSLQVTSYNTLAPSYAYPEWYNHVDPALLAWENRSPLLIDHITSFKSDIICLQEVEPQLFHAALDKLRSQGFEGLYVKKLGDRPDGIAIFYKSASVKFVNHETLYYARSSTEGLAWRPAQILEFEHGGRQYGIVNTHLAWDPLGELAHAELDQLLRERILPHPSQKWIICGDFNVTPDSSAVKLLQSHGLQYAGHGSEQFTYNASTIDYIFHSSDGLQATAKRIDEIQLRTPRPSAMQPSDHLAITAILQPIKRVL